VITLTLATICSPVHAAKPQTKVVTHTVTTGPVLEQIRLSGTVNSLKVAQLSSEVSGLVESLHVDKGSTVKHGDVIMTLDSELESLSLNAADASMRSAEAELADARRRLEDGSRLARQKNISASELKSLQAEVDIASANLQRYIAEKKLQQARVDRHELTAPFDGTITQKYVEVGEWITPGDAIVELFADENIRIDFQVPQRAYPRIQHVVNLSINLDAIPDKTFDGNIEHP
jgi:RND family efflux transporter MFP subunit